MQTLDKPSGLVTAPQLLVELWPNAESRPSLRWLREQQKRRTLPFVKIGKSVFFDPLKVRTTLERKYTVQPRA